MTGSRLDGASVTVMGLGLFGGGASVCRFLAARGARVTVTDLRSAETLAPTLEALADLELRTVLGRHEPGDFTDVDLVVANPAVPPASPFLRAAREAGVRVTSEIGLLLEHAPSRLCGVTGTQGKSSTCNLVAALLSGAGVPARVGGNIGEPLLDRLDELRPDEVVVLELSSYQLEALALETAGRDRRRLEAAAVLNVLEDHLERHGSSEEYARAKRGIVELLVPDGALFVPRDDARLRGWARSDTRTIEFGSNAALRIADGGFELDGLRLAALEDLRLPGEFQRTNALVALGMAATLGARVEDLPAALAGVRGLPHRMEDLGVHGGVRVWDNGVSTTPDSTVAAMRSLAPGFTLLVGGEVKRLPLDELARCAAERARRVVCFGAGAARFAGALAAAGAECELAPDVRGAVALALERALPGEELLFSPAAASFDAYPNFRARALDFREAVRTRASAHTGEVAS